MARSYKKNAAGGYTTASSEKIDKRIWHKRLRTIELQKLNGQNEIEEQIMPVIHEVSDPWAMDKDGKHIYFTENSLRKTINSYISGLINSSDQELYFKNTHSYIMKQFFKYFKISTLNNNILTINDEQKETFIAYIIKMYTRK